MSDADKAGREEAVTEHTPVTVSDARDYADMEALVVAHDSGALGQYHGSLVLVPVRFGDTTMTAVCLAHPDEDGSGGALSPLALLIPGDDRYGAVVGRLSPARGDDGEPYLATPTPRHLGEKIARGQRRAEIDRLEEMLNAVRRPGRGPDNGQEDDHA